MNKLPLITIFFTLFCTIFSCKRNAQEQITETPDSVPAAEVKTPHIYIGKALLISEDSIIISNETDTINICIDTNEANKLQLWGSFTKGNHYVVSTTDQNCATSVVNETELMQYVKIENCFHLPNSSFIYYFDDGTEDTITIIQLNQEGFKGRGCKGKEYEQLQ